MRRILATRLESGLPVLLLFAVSALLAGCGGMTDTGSPAAPGGTSPSEVQGEPGEASPSEPPSDGPDGGLAAGDGPVAAAQRLAEESLDDHGCGHGFTVGTTDGTVRLSLWNEGGFGATPEPGTHELGEEWTGHLVTGEHLFAQWCDDVIEPDEPEVVEDGMWELTGTVTWEVAEGDGQCPTVATATLHDATVVTDGGRVPLADLELRNEFFGCFAG